MASADRAILVTGANGYVGGFIVAELERAGWPVLRGGRFAGADVAIDLDEPEALERQTFPIEVRACIHVAAANEIVCRQWPYRAIAWNVLGTRAMLNSCIRQGVQTFIYVSTFHVFGRLSGLLNEEARPQPHDDYGLSHWQAEQYVEASARAGRISGVVVRPANVFGVPASWDRFDRWTLAPFDFCRQAVGSGQITLRGSGRQRRNYVSGEFVAQRIVELLTKYVPACVHVAGDDVLILDWATRVRDIAGGVLGRDVPLHLGPPGPDDGRNFSFESKHGAREDTAVGRDEFIARTLHHLLETAK